MQQFEAACQRLQSDPMVRVCGVGEWDGMEHTIRPFHINHIDWCWGWGSHNKQSVTD